MANYDNGNFIEQDGGVAFSLASFFPYVTALIFTLLCSIAGFGNQENPVFVYSMYLANQLAIFIVLVYFVKTKNQNPLKLFAVKKTEIKYYLIAIALLFGLLFGVGYLNILFTNFLESVGLEYGEVSVPLNNPLQLVFTIIIIGVFPPIMEELLFRGLILFSLSRLKSWVAIILCGGLFSLFHQNPAQTIYQFITGCVFALIVIKSGSLLPAIVMHLINNIFVIISEYFGFSANCYNAYTISIGLVLFVVTIAYLIFFDKNENKSKEKANIKHFFMGGILGIIFCLIMWFVSLFGV